MNDSNPIVKFTDSLLNCFSSAFTKYKKGANVIFPAAVAAFFLYVAWGEARS